MSGWEIVSLGEGALGRILTPAEAQVSLVFVDSYRGTGSSCEKLVELLGGRAEVLWIELRGTGLNRDLDLTWGVKEVGDIARGVELLDPGRPLVLCGISLGAVAMCVAAAGTLAPALVVAGAPYDRFAIAAQAVLRQEIGMSEAMITFHMDQLRALSPPSPLDVAPAAKCPALFLTGNADEVVPPARTRRLAAAWGGPHEVWELTAGHAGVLLAAIETHRTELRDRIMGAGD